MKIRQRWSVAWDDGEPVEVRCNAYDMSAGADHASNPQMAQMAVVHHALERDGHNVPPLKKWVELLDEFSPLDHRGRRAVGARADGEFIYPDDEDDEAEGDELVEGAESAAVPAAEAVDPTPREPGHGGP
jgi:hypothetical protein